VRCQV